MKIEISVQTLRELIKLIDASKFGGSGPYKVTMEDIEVAGEKAALVKLFFSEQYDGDWQDKYLVTKSGSVRING